MGRLSPLYRENPILAQKKENTPIPVQNHLLPLYNFTHLLWYDPWIPFTTKHVTDVPVAIVFSSNFQRIPLLAFSAVVIFPLSPLAFSFKHMWPLTHFCSTHIFSSIHLSWAYQNIIRLFHFGQNNMTALIEPFYIN